MNRGEMERIAVRLYMLVMRNRIHKSGKANALKQIRLKMTRGTTYYLKEFIWEQINRLEVM